MLISHTSINIRQLRSIDDPLHYREHLHAYKWVHLPSKKFGVTYIASYSKDILPLLNHWNMSDDWKYILVDNKLEV